MGAMFKQETTTGLTLEQIKDLVIFMREQRVESFEIGGIAVDFAQTVPAAERGEKAPPVVAAEEQKRRHDRVLFHSARGG